MLPKQILVPTDLSEGGEPALDFACELAAKLDATVNILNVIGVPAMAVPEIGAAMTAPVMDGIVKDNQAALDRLADAHRGQVHIGQVLLKVGDARSAIKEAARELDADLIVMSTHGRHGISRWLLGSIAESVLRDAPCPVLTIHAAG